MTTIMSTFSDDPINDSVKELERTFLFTDVPSGAMKLRKEDDKQKEPVADDDVSAQVTSICGVLEKTFCFSDLDDINEEDIQRIKSMKSLQQADQVPPVEPADTESCSDDSGTAMNQQPGPGKIPPRTWKASSSARSASPP